MNTKNLTDFLAKNTHASAPNKIILWHTSRNSERLRSYLNEGALPTGKGLGGQKDGFYVWNNKESAISHFNEFLYKNEAGNWLLIGIEVDKDSITYPDWQFDMELSKELNPLLFKYHDKITAIKNLEYKNTKGEERKITSFSLSRYATKENCLLRCWDGDSSTCLAIGDNNGTMCVDMFQALIDKLCEDPDFKKEHDKLLQDSIISANRLALKYCGKKTLSIDRASFIQKGEKGTSYEETLYTSSLPKEKQICPFLKMGIAKKKGPMGM